MTRRGAVASAGQVLLLAGLLALGACGGSGGSQRPVQHQPEPGGGADPHALTPEQIEEVQRTVRMGLQSANVCYTEELERRGGDKSFAGRIVVRILIGTDGQAQSVEIAENTLGAPAVDRCVVEAIRVWEFPQVPTPTWHSTPLEFSPAY